MSDYQVDDPGCIAYICGCVTTVMIITFVLALLVIPRICSVEKKVGINFARSHWYEIGCP